MTIRRVAVCHAEVPKAYGGAEIHVEQLCKQLKAYGYIVDLIALPYKNSTKEELEGQLKLWREIDVEKLIGSKIDLVIGTRFPTYGIRHPHKVTWLIHQYRGVYDLFNTPYSRYKEENNEDLEIRQAIIDFDELSLGESIKIYTNAQNTADRLSKFNHMTGEVLYHPPKHTGHYYHENYGKYILSVGRLDKLKRVDLLIKALQYTSKEIKCLIAGTGREKKTWMQLVRDYKLTDRVEFLGFVPDRKLLELYANCFAVYYAPYDEDYGYVTLEAFLSRKPIITANDSGGVLEFVRDGLNGFIVNPKAKEMGERIDFLFSRRKRICADLGGMGYDSVKEITWANAIEKLTSVQ